MYAAVCMSGLFFALMGFAITCIRQLRELLQ